MSHLEFSAYSLEHVNSSTSIENLTNSVLVVDVSPDLVDPEDFTNKVCNICIYISTPQYLHLL